MAHDTRIYCPTLDDRLGAYLIEHHLPKLGIVPDVLFTTGEEKIQSSAFYFKPPSGKKYNWMFSFDRAGTDVVCYEYWDYTCDIPLKRAGWKHAWGTYSDISEMEHLRIKGFNFGVGYYDEHTLNAYVSEKDLLLNIKKFEKFFKENSNTKLKHTPKFNIWTPEDGFNYIYNPKAAPYQDTFTDAEVEFLEQLEYEGLNFGTRLTPEDVRRLMMESEKYTGQEPVKHPNLFEDLETIASTSSTTEKTEERKPIKVVKHLASAYKSSFVELKPDGKEIPENETIKRLRKEATEELKTGGVVLHRNARKTATIMHSGGENLSKIEKIAEEAKFYGKEVIGPLIHTGEETKQESIQDPVIKQVEEIKGRIVSFIPMPQATGDVRYEYKERKDGSFDWVKIEKRKLKAEELVF